MLGRYRWLPLWSVFLSLCTAVTGLSCGPQLIPPPVVILIVCYVLFFFFVINLLPFDGWVTQW